MKKLSILILIVITAISTLSFYGCSSSVRVYNTFAFGSSVRVEAKGKPFSNGLKKEIKEILTSLENTYSVNVIDSEIDKLNKSTSISSSTEVIKVLNLCKEYYSFTDKKFNPLVYPLNRLWHFAKGTEVDKNNFTPPTKTQIDAILDSGVLDFDKVKIENDTIIKENENIKLDLGGILKGYATDKLSALLLANGYKKGYISLGSSSMFLFEVEKLSVRHPENGNNLIMEINGENIKNSSVSTSGNYEKFYDYENKRYSHIIDANSGYPYDTGIISATILSSNGSFADAMSTALCLCNYEDGNKENELITLINKIVEKEENANVYVFYSKDGEKFLITNKKQGDDFTLLDSTYKIVKI